MQISKSSDEGRTEYGFAFLDYAALKFWVGSISDDDSCASLGALLVQVNLFSLALKQVSLSVDMSNIISYNMCVLNLFVGLT